MGEIPALLNQAIQTISDKYDKIERLIQDRDIPSNYNVVPYRGRYDPRPFEDFMESFNKLGNAKDWSPEVRVRMLPMYLIGEADEGYKSLEDPTKTVYKSLVDALAKRFKWPDNIELQRKRLENRIQLPGESVSEYTAAIKKLVQRSFPTSRFTDANMIKILTIENFVKGLQPELKAQVKREFKGEIPVSLDEAIKAAETEEQIQMSLRRNDSNENPEIRKTLETAQDMSKKLDEITAKMNNMNMVATIPNANGAAAPSNAFTPSGPRRFIPRGMPGRMINRFFNRRPQRSNDYRGIGGFRPNNPLGNGWVRPNNFQGNGSARPNYFRGNGWGRPNDVRGTGFVRPNEFPRVNENNRGRFRPNRQMRGNLRPFAQRGKGGYPINYVDATQQESKPIDHRIVPSSAFSSTLLSLTTLLCLLFFLTFVSAEPKTYQLCDVSNEGQFVAPPVPHDCHIPETNVDIYVEKTVVTSIDVYSCSRLVFEKCKKDYILGGPQFKHSKNTYPVTTEECWEMVQKGNVNGTNLMRIDAHHWESPLMEPSPYIPWFEFEACDRTEQLMVLRGELQTTNGDTFHTDIDWNMENCSFRNKMCYIPGAMMVWEIEDPKVFCKFVKSGTYKALVTDLWIIVDDITAAFVKSNDTIDNEQYRLECFPPATELMENGVAIDILPTEAKELNETIIDFDKNGTSTTKSNRLRREADEEDGIDDMPVTCATLDCSDDISNNEPTATTKTSATSQATTNLPFTTTTKLPNKSSSTTIRTNTRLTDSTKNTSFKFTTSTTTPTTSKMPITTTKSQTATRRQPTSGTSHGETTQAIKMTTEDKITERYEIFRENRLPNNVDISILHKKIRERVRDHLITFKNDSRNKRQDAPKDSNTTQNLEKRLLDTASGVGRQMNHNVNSKLNFGAFKITDWARRSFESAFKHICDSHNERIRLIQAWCQLNPTIGMRIYLARNDIVAERIGEVYKIKGCASIIPSKIYWNNEIDGKCYDATPVAVQNTTFFIKPGTRELMIEANTVECENRTNPIYKADDGKWKTIDGTSPVTVYDRDLPNTPEFKELIFKSKSIFQSDLNELVANSILMASYAKRLNQKEKAKIHVKLIKPINDPFEGFSLGIHRGIGWLKNKTMDAAEWAANSASKVKDWTVEMVSESFSLFRNWISLIRIICAIVLAIILIFLIIFIRVQIQGYLGGFMNLTPITRNVNVITQDRIEPVAPDEIELEHKPVRMINYIPQVYMITSCYGELILPQLFVRVNTIRVLALIDTASNVTFCSRRLARKIGLPGIDPFLNSNGFNAEGLAANNTAMVFEGCINVKIAFGREPFSIMILQSNIFIQNNDESEHDLVLGYNFFRTVTEFGNDFHINLLDNTLTINGISLPLVYNTTAQTDDEVEETYLPIARDATTQANKSDNSTTQPNVNRVHVSSKVCSIIATIQPYLKVYLNNTAAVCLFDTGSCITYCRQSTARNLGIHIEPLNNNVIARAANNTVINFIGRVNIVLKIGEAVLNISVLVSPDQICPSPILIGMDVIRKIAEEGYEISIKPGNDSITIGKSQLPMLSAGIIPEEFTHYDIRSPERYELKGDTEYEIWVKIDLIFPESWVMMVSDHEKNPRNDVMIVARTACTPGSLKYVPLRLTTWGKAPIIIDRGTVIAKLELLRDDWRPGSTSEICSIDREVIEGNLEYDPLYIPPETDWASKLPPMLDDLVQNEPKLSDNINFEGTCLSLSAQRKLKVIIDSCQDAFYRKGGFIGHYNGPIKHRIDLEPGTKPIQKRPYRVPIGLRDEIQRQIDEQVKQGIIEASDSPFASPICLVMKKDKTYRFCVDYRGLNDKTIKQKSLLPLMLDLYDQLPSEGRIFSSFDFVSGFYQIDVYPPHRERTAFATWNGMLYHYIRLPMGLTGAPATFQKVMESIRRELTIRIFCYLDDAIIVSEDEDEHLRDIGVFLKTMIKFNMTLKLEKCQFGRTKIKYLGMIISPEGISPDPNSVRKVLELEPPKTLKQLRSFLGMCSYWRRYIRNFAGIMSPLYELTKKNDEDPNTKIEKKWSPEHQKAFEEIKKKLTTAPVLAAPKFRKPFVIETDASKKSIAACLIQADSEGNEHPVAYASRAMNRHESRYPSVESEALAIVYAIEQFRPYIEGNSTTIVKTDNSALCSLFRRQDLVGRLAKYQMTIQAIDLKIVHRSGSSNVVADYLSRHAPSNDISSVVQLENDLAENDTKQVINQVVPELPNLQIVELEERIETNAITRKAAKDMGRANSRTRIDETKLQENITLDQVRAEQRKIAEFQQIYDSIKYDKWPVSKQDRRRLERLSAKYVLRDDLIYYNPTSDEPDSGLRLLIPYPLREAIIKLYHSSPIQGAHSGEERTVNLIRSRFFWPGWTSDIFKFVKECHVCQTRKPNSAVAPKNEPLHPIKPANRPWAQLHCDLIGPLPISNRKLYILTVVDSFSKLLATDAITHKTAHEVSEALLKIFCIYGIPDTLASDRGKEFLNEVMTNLSQMMGFKQIHTSAYCPASNGQAERFNANIVNMLATFVNKAGNNWTDYLSLVTAAYNATVNTITNETPFFIMHGFDPRLPSDVGLISKEDIQYVNIPQYKSELIRKIQIAYETVRSNIMKAQIKQKIDYDEANDTHPSKLQRGDLVVFYRDAPPEGERTKFYRKWTGPFRIGMINGPNVTLQYVEGNKEPFTTHINKVKAYNSQTTLPLRRLDAPPELLNNDEKSPLISHSDDDSVGQAYDREPGVESEIDTIANGNVEPKYNLRIRPKKRRIFE
uniref:RNA-directed DNA polymerase n=1 Tax=Acrobeloides nanus TaxID=290746 RepID=A0A914EPM1_9BILA